MPLNEILNGRRHISHLEIAAPAQLAGDILRNIFRPALGRIEGDDADRIAILAGKQVLNDGLKISGLVVGLPPSAADLPKIIGNEIDRLIAVSGTIEGVQLVLRIRKLRHNRHSSRPEEFGSDCRRRRVIRGLLVKASQSSGVFGVNSKGLLGRGVSGAAYIPSARDIRARPRASTRVSRGLLFVGRYTDDGRLTGGQHDN